MMNNVIRFIQIMYEYDKNKNNKKKCELKE